MPPQINCSLSEECVVFQHAQCIHAGDGEYSPFHVASFCPPEGKDAIFGEEIQTERVDTFLVDDDEILGLFFRVDGLITNEVLEFHNLLDFRVSESPF